MGMGLREPLAEDICCALPSALEAIGERWSLLIVRDAFDGMRRFGEFQKSLGVAKNILADRLHVRFQMQLHKLLWGNMQGK